MKVANPLYVAKSYSPTNLYAIAAPPPSQVEGLKKLPPPERAKPTVPQREWRAKLKSKRATKKRKEKLERKKQRAYEAKENLILHEAALRAQTQRLIQANQPKEETPPQYSPSDDEAVPIPVPPAWGDHLPPDGAHNITEAELLHLTITNQIPTAIADAGASSNCGIQ